jgi:hypothetical protein
MANAVTLVRASVVATFADVMTATETAAVAGQTYTFQAAVGTTANEVKIGADITNTVINFVAAINAGTGSGTLYGSNTVRNADVTAVASATDEVTLYALVPGTIGNQIPVVDDGDITWASANLASGSGDLEAWVQSLLSLNQINSEVMAELKKLTYASD